MESNYYLIADMERYNQNFNRDEWYNKRTIEETKSAFKEIYKALGKAIDVTTWIRLYDADEKYIYSKAQRDQVCFVRDKIAPMFYEIGCRNNNDEEYMWYHDNFCKVINTHMSKSVNLPVYNFKSEKYGIEVTMRNNFYNWMVSVESTKNIECDFMGIIYTSSKINPIYCEGMDDIDKVFGSYTNNKSCFTAEIGDNYNLYTFMFLLKNCLSK